MANDDASGASPSITDPLPAASGFNATEFLRKYWWEIALVIGVIAFLIYTYLHNNNSQVGTTSTTASADPNASGTTSSTTAADSANASALQNLANQIADLTTAQNKDNAGDTSGGKIFPGGDPHGHPKPYTSPPSAALIRWRKKQGYSPAATMAHGGPPASGPKVPFGTHIGLHAPLTSSGDMYATAR